MRILLAIYFWTLLVIVTAVLALGIFLLHLLGIITRQAMDRPNHMIASFWGWLLIKAVPVWKLSIDGKEHLLPGRHYVIIANHESMSDIWAVFCLFTQFRWLAKSSLLKVPVIGQAMQYCGYVPVDRGNRQSHAQAMRIASEWLQRGVSMFFFPEGTRTNTGKIGAFKLGAFKLAESAKVEILPLVIKGARDLLPKGSMLPGPAHVRIRVLPAMQKLSDETVEAFAERARAKIIAAAETL